MNNYKKYLSLSLFLILLIIANNTKSQNHISTYDIDTMWNKDISKIYKALNVYDSIDKTNTITVESIIKTHDNIITSYNFKDNKLVSKFVDFKSIIYSDKIQYSEDSIISRLNKKYGKPIVESYTTHKILRYLNSNTIIEFHTGKENLNIVRYIEYYKKD